ncbi:hypothetical protein [Mangrovihabitans endophyticus]|uniref:Uncharacterized protein n=1 Tax=Mangrovihabitans endophyticus TaxID=1751298 RepID=A0A8J3FRS9_9ACTN|nr:hypothetical protein [Mangrovihabitans endophyticus]GGL11802.1 hypothetical protein GCM10012284_53180 [Mangrovihabitans endophyticus]
MITARESAASLSLRPTSTTDDGLLTTLLSYAPLTDRGAVLQFLQSAATRSREDGHRFGPLCMRIFRAVVEMAEMPVASYRPRHLIAADRQAVCALNLLLLTMACRPVTAGQLFPDSDDPVDEWRRWIERWQAAVGSDSWGTFNQAVMPERGWSAEGRELTVRLCDSAGGPPLPAPIDAYWTHSMPPASTARDYLGFRLGDDLDARRTYSLRCHPIDDVVMHAAEPMLNAFGPAMSHFAPVTPDDFPSAAHVLAATWLASGPEHDGDALTAAYRRAVHVLTRCWAPRRLPQSPGYERAVASSMTTLLRLLSRDASRLSPVDVDRWAIEITFWEYAQADHLMWILDCRLTAALADTIVRDTGRPGLRDICRKIGKQMPVRRGEGELAVRVWAGLHLIALNTEARGIFGDRESFLADRSVAAALRRDPRLGLQVDAVFRRHA